MELNEVTKRLPPHLMQFVVDQPYNSYTPIDQAVWRYVMRQNYYHLQKVAHESYVEGLKKTGVEIENIPTMYGMNRILKEIGWAAVAVDGFIPPGAFMEFTKYNVLVIAADIRTIDHIEYTPAPDIIHESAGHAPIIAEPEFAEYLRYIGEVGSKAFSSKKDYELYEAIRHLSIIKEDPNTNEKDIEQAEKEIEVIQANMGEPSELALIRNLHWWTVEYGLIGTVDNYKLYGAGLLSSIGESKSCLSDKVKKIPYSLEAAYCNYDITKRQPQLFVSPSFKHLTKVLNEFKQTMAWVIGGLDGIKKAISSEHTATCVFSSGLQVSGTITEVIIDHNNLPIFIKTSGPTALAYNNQELPGCSKDQFPKGFSAPIGKIKNCSLPFENLSNRDLLELGIGNRQLSTIEFESGITVKGLVIEIVRSPEGKIILINLKNALLAYQGSVLEKSLSYTLAVGEKIISTFAGAADIEAFQPVVQVPKEKTHKIHYDKKDLALQNLYRKVREYRNKSNTSDLQKIWEEVVSEFAKDWLLSLEILEILSKNNYLPDLERTIKKYLEEKKERQPELQKLINDGLELVLK